jgi:putative glutamine amidotransferase
VKYDLIHPIRAIKGTALHTLYGPVFPVNSYHHQAVDVLGAGLAASAWSESGFPEAFCHSTAPILGVQFHPERLTGELWDDRTPDFAPLFNYFVGLCK